ncbi:MAG: anthranilate phosphoribosyltransferase, partial [Chryseobacterium taeanense]
MKEILEYLFNHNTLSKSEAKAIMIEIAQNKFNATEVTAFISVFLMRNITLKELEGFREALLDMAVPVNIDSN